MKARNYVVLLALLLMVGSVSIASAQDGGDDSDNPLADALLTQLRTAYATTAEQESYVVSTEETMTQFTSVRRFQSGTYLMNVEIFESYVNTQTLETSVEATVVGDETAATFAMDISQVQGLGFEYVRNGVVLQTPEDTEDELELDLVVRQTADDTYINTDETDIEFREGVPEGWRRLDGDETPILTNSSITISDVNEVLLGLRVTANSEIMQNLLLSENIIGIDIVGDDTIGDQPVRRYRIEFDGAAAFTVLDLNYEQILADLNAAADDTVGDSTPIVEISYTIELAVGTDNNLVYEQIATLTIDALFEGTTNNAAINIAQVTAVTYSGFGETYSLQPIDELIGG